MSDQTWATLILIVVGALGLAVVWFAVWALITTRGAPLIFGAVGGAAFAVGWAPVGWALLIVAALLWVGAACWLFYAQLSSEFA